MHLHLDCFAGIAGDMTLGALIDLGVPIEDLEAELRKLPIGDWSLSIEKRDAGHGIVGVGITVGDVQLDPTESHDGDHHHTGDDRTFVQIVELIRAASLAPDIEECAITIFRRIAEAESRVHGVTVDEITFHEVGAIDSIVDIVGTAIALSYLGVETISASPVPLGYGFTKSQHGRIPIPAPATVECLRGVPCYDSGLKVELVTPTGAGIVGGLATQFTHFPPMTIERVGYGTGSRRHADRPNVLRAILGRPAQTTVGAATLETDEVWEISANVDDQTPEELAHASTVLLEIGALDVWTTPIVMKKGRLGHKLTALCSPSERSRVIEIILRHTSSLGVRLARLERVTLDREVTCVSTQYGEIRVKLGRGRDGSVWNLAPEADDLVRAAQEHEVPMKVVRQAALEKMRYER